MTNPLTERATFKTYMRIFNVSSATAKRMIARDRKNKRQKKMLTIGHIYDMYALVTVSKSINEYQKASL